MSASIPSTIISILSPVQWSCSVCAGGQERMTGQIHEIPYLGEFNQHSSWVKLAMKSLGSGKANLRLAMTSAC